jgi:hypothetical protein
MLLVYRVVFVIASSSYCCKSFYWFIVLLILLLVCCVPGCVASSSCCWYYLLFIVLFLNTCLNHLLILCIVRCYSHCMCFDEVLPPLRSLCRWRIGGPSRCYTPLTMRYPPSPFNLLGAIVGLSHCQCCY